MLSLAAIRAGFLHPPLHPVQAWRSDASAGLGGQIAATEARRRKPHRPLAFPSRPRYAPGELVDYIAQTGDTLPGLAVRFNTTVDEILAANSFIPQDATTMPPGMPMKIPIYYLPLWGSPYQILPDSLFVNGPAQVGFDIEKFVTEPSRLAEELFRLMSPTPTAAARRLWITSPTITASARACCWRCWNTSRRRFRNPSSPPRMRTTRWATVHWSHKGLFLQLAWAANLLNDGYYKLP